MGGAPRLAHQCANTNTTSTKMLFGLPKILYELFKRKRKAFLPCAFASPSTPSLLNKHQPQPPASLMFEFLISYSRRSRTDGAWPLEEQPGTPTGHTVILVRVAHLGGSTTNHVFLTLPSLGLLVRSQDQERQEGCKCTCLSNGPLALRRQEKRRRPCLRHQSATARVHAPPPHTHGNDILSIYPYSGSPLRMCVCLCPHASLSSLRRRNPEGPGLLLAPKRAWALGPRRS